MFESFSRGNVCYIDEDYEAAVQHYDEALKATPRDACILSCRAAALIKVKKYMKALEDVNNAISLNPQHEMSYFRKGLACFELEEYETAKASFQEGMNLRSKVKGSDITTYQRWIRKCNSELTSKMFRLCPFSVYLNSCCVLQAAMICT